MWSTMRARAEAHSRPPEETASRLRGTLSRISGAGNREVSAGPGRHRAERTIRDRNQVRASHLDSGHRARRVHERREPVSQPLSTVEINDIVALAEQEAEQVPHPARCARRFRARAADLARTIDAAIELDVLQARARFSESIDGSNPRCRTVRSSFRLRGIRSEGRSARHRQDHPAGGCC
jgi:hypothetical protein